MDTPAKEEYIKYKEKNEKKIKQNHRTKPINNRIIKKKTKTKKKTEMK